MDTAPKLTDSQRANVLALCVALESGKYRKGVNRLRTIDTDGHCCIGVACDVSGVGEWVFLSEHPAWAYRCQNECERWCADNDVRQHFGFPESDGFTVTIDGVEASMLRHNDGGTVVARGAHVREASHPEIARAIRTQILGESEVAQ